MNDHKLFVVSFTHRVPYGEWVSHDEKRVDGYSEPQEANIYYVAPSAEVAKAHWLYWNKFRDKEREVKFVSIKEVGQPIMILEIH